MKPKTSYFSIFIVLCLLLNVSCIKKENKNLVTESEGRDPRIDNLFNALGLQLKDVNGNDIDAVSAELTRVSPLFTNAMPPKINGVEQSRPFYLLAKNVGEYFVSQIWKTQITSTDEIRFFDLAQDVNDSQSGIQYSSSDFDVPFLFLNPYGDQTDPKNSLGYIQKGFYFGLNGQGQKEVLSHFYVMEYKLRDENGSKFGQHVRTYYALVSIPADTASQYRLIMYAHGGDYGTSASELVNIFNKKLKEFVVVAPLFPGEPLCMQIAAQGKGCLRFDDQNKLIPDYKGLYHNPTIQQPLHSVIPLEYPRAPLIEDINAFLGAHNAVSRMMDVTKTTNPFYNETLKNKSILLAMEHPKALINLSQHYAEGGEPMIPTGLAPQTVGIGSSRGGGVLMAAIGRIGFLLNPLSADSDFVHAIQDNSGELFHFQYPLFNGAVLIGSPSSMVTGKMRLLTMMVMQNETEPIASLPMAVDLAHNEFFTNYRKDENYFSEIQLTSFKPHEYGFPYLKKDTLSQLITFIASNDVTFLAPFIATGLQNWNSYYDDDDENLHTRAPSSLALLHGSQDLVVPMTESTIAAQAMNTIWAGLYNTTFDPFGNYLHDEQFKVLHESFVQSAIPGVGVTQFTFQPTNHFFNIPCEKSKMASIQQPNIIYNTNVGRCFGGGYSSKADGKETVGRFSGHLDASFFTGRLVNMISRDNLNTGILSSNIIRKEKDLTMKSDSKLNMHSDPCDKNFDCATLLKSTTFMRYMSAEGIPSANIISAKKQIFEGEFNPIVGILNADKQDENKKILQPHDVLFAWLDNVACDKCDDKNADDSVAVKSHYGVFHDYYRD